MLVDASVWLGSAAGLSPWPAWTATSPVPSESGFGMVGAAGDVNGDGYDDVLFGAPNDDGNTGAAFLWLGSPTGPGATPDASILGDRADTLFGGGVAGAGDVNGDGYDDVLVGAFWYTDDEPEEGAAFLYLGAPGGPSATADWRATGDQPYAHLGAVAGAGDVNGDGFDDVLVGAGGHDGAMADMGSAALYLGSATGLATTPAWTAEGDWMDSSFGGGTAAGDVNGDGFGDVFVGASGYGSDQGYVFLGSAAGLAATAAWTAREPTYARYFGRGALGDLDGDGFDDLVVGAPTYDDVGLGRVFVYRGSAGGLSASADQTLSGAEDDDAFGTAVAAPDTNGDGFAELLVGAPGTDDGELDEGAAFLFVLCEEAAFFVDADGDGLGDPEDAVTACGPAPGYVANGDDAECPDDPANDADVDGVCDGDDRCLGSDDGLDTDADGLPDGCDACPDDATGDRDGDGVCDGDDRCPGHPDNDDADGDGLPDACDPCDRGDTDACTPDRPAPDTTEDAGGCGCDGTARTGAGGLGAALAAWLGRFRRGACDGSRRRRNNG